MWYLKNGKKNGKRLFVPVSFCTAWKSRLISAALHGLRLTLYNRLCDGFNTLVFDDGKQFQRRAAWLFNTPLPC